MPLRTNGAEIRRRRELLGLTQTAFAQLIGYGRNTVGQIELGNLNGGPNFCAAAARGLGCEVADITSGHIPYGEVHTSLESAQ